MLGCLAALSAGIFSGPVMCSYFALNFIGLSKLTDPVFQGLHLHG